MNRCLNVQGQSPIRSWVPRYLSSTFELSILETVSSGVSLTSNFNNVEQYKGVFFCVYTGLWPVTTMDLHYGWFVGCSSD